MTYKGVVKENTVILPADAHLPNGTVVEGQCLEDVAIFFIFLSEAWPELRAGLAL